MASKKRPSAQKPAHKAKARPSAASAQSEDALDVQIAPKAHEDIWLHAESDLSVENCGFLVGNIFAKAGGTRVVATDAVRGEQARGQATQVTFTHDTWAHVYRVLDEELPGKRIVGWYHSHPGFGVFLSQMDEFIQESFFSEPWQVALVVDPVRKEEAVFRWADKEIRRHPFYRVGQERHGEESQKRRSRPDPEGLPAEAASPNKPGLLARLNPFRRRA